MKDMLAHLEELQTQISECKLIRDLATEPKKRELFARLAEHYRVLAAEVKKAMIAAEPYDSAADEARRLRDKAAEAEQLAEIAETKSRRGALTHIASIYLRTAEQLDGLKKADRSLKPKDRSKK